MPLLARIVRPLIAIAWLVVGASSLAAQWSLTADVPVAGTLRTHASSVSVPVGPVAPGVIGSISSGAALTTVSWSSTAPQRGGLVAFRFRMQSAVLPLVGFGSTSGNVVLDITARGAGQSPQRGVWVVRASRLALGPGSTSTEVDIGADGTAELSGSATELVSASTLVPTGSVVRIALSTSAQAFLMQGGSGDATVECEFVPGHAIVQRAANYISAARLRAEVLAPNQWQLDLAGATSATTPIAIVFGAQPTSVVLAPGLLQLVADDVVLPGGRQVFDLPPMASGFRVYAQGLMFDASGRLVSSNSVLARWF